jgi:uncharacterized protein YbjQ (UPF0145 family)
VSLTSGGPGDADVRAEMRKAVEALGPGQTNDRGPDRAVTSDLSIDESLLLHSIGWEPVDLVFGVSVTSVWAGAWTWGRGEITAASTAHNMAMAAAATRMREECTSVHGHGVVGVRVDIAVRTHHVDVELTGTAVRPVGHARTPAEVFVSDLSARDFALLHNAGWAPLGLAFGASFVYAPRRSAGSALRQSSQNVELTNYTEALYSARESAMERMQSSALALGARGIVAVTVTEGPMPFARHAIGFTAWGTAVRLEASSHQRLDPAVVLSLDDAVVQFQAESLRT